MNKEEFEHRFTTHYRFLCTIAYGIVNDVPASEDIVQQFFYRLLEQPLPDMQAEQFRYYAFTAVKNAAISWLRKQKRTSQVYAMAQDNQFTDPVQEQEQEMQYAEQLAATLLAIEEMPEQRRRVFLLKNEQQLSYQDIADKLGISINTVKTLMKQAYQFIRHRCTLLLTLLLLFKK